MNWFRRLFMGEIENPVAPVATVGTPAAAEMKTVPFSIDAPTSHRLSSVTASGNGHITAVMPPQLIVGNRQRFKQDVMDLVNGGAREVVLDFARTTYLDSSGCGVLLTVTRYARDHECRLVLRNLNADLRTLMELTRMDTALTIEPDVPR